MLSRTKLNILVDPWLHATINKFVFTDNIAHLISLKSSGFKICHTTLHFHFLKYFFADSNHKKIFNANFPTILFDNHGTESDSCIYTGIQTSFHAIAIGSDTYHHFEKIKSGFNFFKIFNDCKIQIIILHGSTNVLKEKYRLNFQDFIIWKSIQLSFEIFSSIESFSQTQKKLKSFFRWL